MPKILVIEDDKYLNKLISDRLVREGFEVTSLLDGESAWNALNQSIEEGDPFEIILTDMLLPKMMGAELLSKINEDERFKELKLLAMSGIYKDAQQIEEMKTLQGLSAYWTKPFQIDDLVASLTGKVLSRTEGLIPPGNLSDHPIELVILDAYDKGFHGKLSIRKKDVERNIYFSKGFPVSASSTAIAESLGRSLVSMKYVDEATYQKASNEMVTEKLQLGQMLVKMGALTNESLFEALRKHTYRVLMNSFTWREGDYDFVPLADLPAHVLQLEFNPILLIFQAHRRLYRKEFLQSLYETKRDDYGHFSTRFFQLLPMLNLDTQSENFLSQLDGSKRLREILANIPSESHESLFRVFFLFETLRLLSWKAEAQRDSFEIPTTMVGGDAPKDEVSPDILQSLQAEYIEMINKDFFAMLLVDENASEKVIEESYRQIRFRLHPDRFGQMVGGQSKRILDDMLSRLDKAYQTLSNPESRAEYLSTLKRHRADSVADSKRFLEAQDSFRLGIKLMNQQKWKDASVQFRKAYQTWSRGFEYQLHALYCEFREAFAENPEIAQRQPLQTFRDICHKHGSSDVGFTLLGNAYLCTQQFDLARQAFQQAIAINDKNDDAASALQALASKQIKKERVARAIKNTRPAIFRVFTWLGIGVAVAIAFTYREYLFVKEDGITQLQTSLLRDEVPAVEIRQKGDTAKIVLEKGWMQNVPDSVLKSKCLQIFKKTEGYGIIRLYFYESEGGLKAICRGNQMLRYR